MAGDWTSMYAIMQDLSVAQGGMPVIVNGIVSASDRPPTPIIDDDIEEEYYKELCTGGDYTKPDLGLIKEMLDMVRDKDISECEEDLVISKPLLVNTLGALAPNPSAKPVKPKIKPCRNIAMMSLLKIESDREAELLKTEELKKENSSSVFNSTSNTKPRVQLAPSNMFKKKVHKSPQKDTTPEVKVAKPKGGDYKPSTMADEYYKKYMERSKVKELAQEDIWSRLERQMKEIDAKRKQELLSRSSPSCNSVTLSPDRSHTSDISDISADTSLSPNTSKSSNERPTSSTSESPASTEVEAKIKIPCEVILAQQRHKLPGECVVCTVLTDRGYDVTQLPVDI